MGELVRKTRFDQLILSISEHDHRVSNFKPSFLRICGQRGREGAATRRGSELRDLSSGQPTWKLLQNTTIDPTIYLRECLIGSTH